MSSWDAVWTNSNNSVTRLKTACMDTYNLHTRNNNMVRTLPMCKNSLFLHSYDQFNHILFDLMGVADVLVAFLKFLRVKEEPFCVIGNFSKTAAAFFEFVGFRSPQRVLP